MHEIGKKSRTHVVFTDGLISGTTTGWPLCFPYEAAPEIAGAGAGTTAGWPG